MSLATFKVRGAKGSRLFDGQDSATIVIDRALGLVHVRPKGAREPATMSLTTVAALVLWRVAKEKADVS